ncbi:uncharacterized protein METZ01_LOCUS411823 [marine metagenome]|uniref:Uncharacterized protein n=1 Tax=marine metagenome TaxID=408172 RepID=A0A382WJY5_9ZZZZ
MRVIFLENWNLFFLLISENLCAIDNPKLPTPTIRKSQIRSLFNDLIFNL